MLEPDYTAISEAYEDKRQNLAVEEDCVRTIFEQLFLKRVSPFEPWSVALEKGQIQAYIDSKGYEAASDATWTAALEEARKLHLSQKNTLMGAHAAFQECAKFSVESEHGNSYVLAVYSRGGAERHATWHGPREDVLEIVRQRRFPVPQLWSVVWPHSSKSWEG